MKKLTLLLTFLCLVQITTAQHRRGNNRYPQRYQQRERTATLREIVTLDIGGKGLGLSYEIPTSRRKSFVLSAGLGGGYQINTNGDRTGYSESNYQYNINPDNPSIYGEITRRRYYELNGGRTNTGKYVALSARYTSESLGDVGFDEYNHQAMHLTAHWGKQRRLGTNWVLNYHLGLGYGVNLDSEDGVVYPAVGFRFARNL